MRSTPDQHRQLTLAAKWLPFCLLASLLLLSIWNFVQLTFSAAYTLGGIIAVVLTALAVVFSGVLTHDRLSTAHMVGMFAFLISPGDALPFLTLCTLMGGGVGLLLQQQLSPHRQYAFFHVRTLFVLSRITLSFWVASVFYLFSDLPLPIQTDSLRPLNYIFSLSVYAFVYLATYGALYLLQIIALYPQQAKLSLRSDLAKIAAILILPVPFTIIGAEIFTLVSLASKVMLMLGLAMLIFAIYALTRSEARLRKQFDDMQTITAVMEAMRSQLDINQILTTTFRQISEIIPVDTLIIALKDADTEVLHCFQINDEQSRAIDPLDSGAQPILEQVLRSGTVHSGDLDGELYALDDAVRSVHRLTRNHRWLSLPLIASDRVIGAIAMPIEHLPSAGLSSRDLHLLKIIAASGGIAIQNAQHYQHQTDRAARLVTLNRIGSLLSGTLSPDLILDTIISSASIISQANAFAVHLFWDEASPKLPTRRTAGFQSESEETIPPLIMQLQRNLTDLNPNDTTGNVPVVISDVATDTRTLSNVELFKQQATASLIEMPLETGSKAFGIIAFYYQQPKIFTTDEIEVLRTFSTQAAQAINNAQVYTTTDEAFQRSIEQLLTLANIGRVLTSSIDLEKICELILSNLIAVTRVHGGAVILKDFKTNEPRVMAQVGYDAPIEHTNTLMERGILRHVEYSGAPWRVEDSTFEADYFSILSGSKSQLAAPITLNYEMRGVILVESKQTRAFNDEDVYFVTQVANQAVIAIENARLFSHVIEGRDRLQVLLDAMEEGIILVDRDGVVALANPRIDLIGLNASRITGRRLSDLIREPELRFCESTGFDSNDTGLRFAEAIQKAELHAPINYVVRADHQITHIRRQVIPIFDQNQAVMGQLLIFYNKTQEEELAKTREDMSRMIVHDLRSPLTAVTTSLKLLQDYVPRDTEFYPLVQTLTDTSRRAIRKLLSRVDSILDIAKLQSGQISLEKEISQIDPIVANVKQELEPLAKEIAVQIKIESMEALPLLDIDVDKIERVVLNLVDNAMKYSPSNASVLIQAEKLVSTEGADIGVCIKILDRGPGVPDDYKDHLFDQFVQVDGRRKVRRGVGLGLTFCRLVIEAHGGKIWIEDRDGGGSAFIFTLPSANIESSLLTDENR